MIQMPRAAWTDANPNGLLGFVPSMFIVVWGNLWHMNWPLGMYVNNYKGESGTSGNGIEYLRPSTVCGVRRRRLDQMPANAFHAAPRADPLPDEQHDRLRGHSHGPRPGVRSESETMPERVADARGECRAPARLVVDEPLVF